MFAPFNKASTHAVFAQLRWQMTLYTHYLVGGLEDQFYFSIIYGIILLIDFHVFQDG